MAIGQSHVTEIEAFLAERGTLLLRAATLLAGSREAGEDLLQTALERMIRNWRRIDGNPEGYLRRTIYNLAADGWRRQRSWRDRLPLLRASPADGVVEGTEAVDLRDQLTRLLDQLPPRQRAIIVLRHWEQLSEAETAELLGCSPGTVKAAGSKGMRRLRELSVTTPALEIAHD
jgi:RNA polymerase sigma-70 factor (sigma-E family)